MNNLRKNNEGVSTIIGNILMVAVAVILAAIIAANSFGLFSEQKIAPQASIRILSIDTSANTITLEHQGGGDLVLSFVKVIIEQGNDRVSYPTAGQASDRFVAGDKLVVATSVDSISLNGGANTTHTPASGIGTDLVAGSELTVTMIDLPSGQKISSIKSKT